MLNPAGFRSVLDTSVVSALGQLDPQTLPQEAPILAVTLAERAAGPHATSDAAERARCQDRLQRVEATVEPISVDANVARAYGQIYAAVVATGCKARGRRAFDWLSAATALSEGLPLCTANPDDATDVAGLVDVGPVRLPPA